MRSRAILITVIATLVGAALGSATLSSAAPPSPSPTQIVGQLEVGGVKGEGSEQAFVGAVEARSFSFSASRPGSRDADYERFQVSAGIDSASVALLERLSRGTNIPTVRFSLTRNGERGLTAYKVFTLSDARVTTLREYASGQGSDIPMIDLGFAYKRLKVEYRGQNADGSAADPITFCWNVLSGAAC